MIFFCSPESGQRVAVECGGWWMLVADSGCQWLLVVVNDLGLEIGLRLGLEPYWINLDGLNCWWWAGLIGQNPWTLNMVQPEKKWPGSNPMNRVDYFGLSYRNWLGWPIQLNQVGSDLFGYELTKSNPLNWVDYLDRFESRPTWVVGLWMIGPVGNRF